MESSKRPIARDGSVLASDGIRLNKLRMMINIIRDIKVTGLNYYMELRNPVRQVILYHVEDTLQETKDEYCT